MTLPIGLQLYTVRDALKRDFDATLKQLAAIGYRHVELAGLPRPASDIRRLLDTLGLKACGAHVGIDQFDKHLDQVVSDARTLGYRVVTCPWIGEEWRGRDGYRKLAAKFNDIGRKLADAGLQFAYHNHAFEFEPIDGTTGMDILFSETDAKLVHSELDLYWVRHGGHDPAAWMKKLTGRIPLVHVKDMRVTASGEKQMTEVGTGVIDYAALARLAPAAGVTHLIIEQDNGWIDNDPVKSATMSLWHLSKVLG